MTLRKIAFHRIPGLGMRTVKTAVAVAICVAFFMLVGTAADHWPVLAVLKKTTAFYASSAAVICLQNTVRDSVRQGISRVIGTLIGGGVAIMILMVETVRHNFGGDLLQLLCIFIGVVVTIVVCLAANQDQSVVIACIVLIIILLGYADSATDRYIYAGIRMFETVIGIAVAVGVNKFMRRPHFPDRFLSEEIEEYPDEKL